MESSSANTTNMQSTPYVSTPNVSEPAAQPQQQPTVANVDMTGGSTTPVEVKASPMNNKGDLGKTYDSENKTVSPKYTQTYMTFLGKKPQFTTNENGDETCFMAVMKAAAEDKNILTDIFRESYMKISEKQTAHKQAQQLFENLDNINYRYMHDPRLGNMRVMIDPETGKDIGLPEPIDASGNKLFMDDPKNLPTLA